MDLISPDTLLLIRLLQLSEFQYILVWSIMLWLDSADSESSLAIESLVAFHDIHTLHTVQNKSSLAVQNVALKRGSHFL